MCWKHHCSNLKFSKREGKSACRVTKFTVWYFSGKLCDRSLRKKIPASKMRRVFYSPRDHGRMGQLRECKFFLSIIFLLWQNDVVPQEIHTLLCPSDEIFEFFFLTQTSFFVREKKLKDFILRTKQSMNFLRDHIILPQEKNNWQKKFALPQFPHPSMISWRIKAPFSFC